MSLQKNLVLCLTETRGSQLYVDHFSFDALIIYKVKINIVCSASVRCVLGKYWSLKAEKEEEQIKRTRPIYFNRNEQAS